MRASPSAPPQSSYPPYGPVLGAILAGGQSSRFGSDKALALHDGVALIDHVAAALVGQSDTLAVVGREYGGFPAIDDRPSPGLGPLGAIAGALHWARCNGFAAVLSAPCDALRLPDDLAARLSGDGPAFVPAMPVIGWWPSALADDLENWLRADQSRAVRHWAAAIDARPVALATMPLNVNSPADLQAIG